MNFDVFEQHYAWYLGQFEGFCQMSPMTHQDFPVYAITVTNNHNADNMDKFDALVSRSLIVTYLHIYLTFARM